MSFFEIPLTPQQQTVPVKLGSNSYNLRFFYINVEDGGWCMDISDAGGTPLACGIPLVTGADLLGQYEELGIPGELYLTTDGDPDAVPTFASLGVTSHLLFKPR